MFKNLQALEKEKHRDLKIKPLEDLYFARDMTNIPVIIGESSIIAKDFPLVFISDSKGNYSLCAIVSLGSSGNLALNKERKWITDYIPSFLRRYPFTIASVENDPKKRVVMIDEDAPCISKSTGMELFDKDQEQSELLKSSLNFLQKNFEQTDITKKIVQEIQKAEILEDREIAIDEGEERKVLVKGFKVVDRDKLDALGDDILASWVRRGIISFIDIHLNSLDKINDLFTLANNRQ